MARVGERSADDVVGRQRLQRERRRAAQSAVGEQQRHVIVGAWCDENHVRTGHVEVSLQVMVEVP